MPQAEKTDQPEISKQPSAAEDAAVAMLESASRREKQTKVNLPWWKRLRKNIKAGN